MPVLQRRRPQHAPQHTTRLRAPLERHRFHPQPTHCQQARPQTAVPGLHQVHPAHLQDQTGARPARPRQRRTIRRRTSTPTTPTTAIRTLVTSHSSSTLRRVRRSTRRCRRTTLPRHGLDPVVGRVVRQPRRGDALVLPLATTATLAIGLLHSRPHRPHVNTTATLHHPLLLIPPPRHTRLQRAHPNHSPITRIGGRTPLYSTMRPVQQQQARESAGDRQSLCIDNWSAHPILHFETWH